MLRGTLWPVFKKVSGPPSSTTTLRESGLLGPDDSVVPWHRQVLWRVAGKSERSQFRQQPTPLNNDSSTTEPPWVHQNSLIIAVSQALRAGDSVKLAEVLCDGVPPIRPEDDVCRLLTMPHAQCAHEPYATCLLEAANDGCNTMEFLEVMLSVGVQTFGEHLSFEPVAYARDPDVLELLLDIGGDADSKPEPGSYESCLIEPEDCLEFVQVLLCHGADPVGIGGENLQEFGCVPPVNSSAEILECFLQAGAHDQAIAGAFWRGSDHFHFADMQSVLRLDGVIDDATRDLCQEELGVRFESLGSLVEFLDDPLLDLCRLTPRLVGHLRMLLLLGFDACRRLLVEALVLAGATLPQETVWITSWTPIFAGCFARDDECEMMSLLLCSDPVFDVLGVSLIANHLVNSVRVTGTLGPSELMMMCGLASAALTSPWNAEHNPLLVIVQSNVSQLLDQMLKWVVVPPERLTCAMVRALDAMESLGLLFDSCEELSMMLDDCQDPPLTVPLLSAGYGFPCPIPQISSWIRLMAQCGVDLDPLLTDNSHLYGTGGSGEDVWRETVAHNRASIPENETWTIFWPVCSATSVFDH